MPNIKECECWIQTISGVHFSILNPRWQDVQIDDIAHALSVVPRFSGHTRHPYSVAQHSVLVSYECLKEHALWGLLHDAAEAYVGDVSRPLKRLMRGSQRRPSSYDRIEAKVMAAVCQRFGLQTKEPGSIKVADTVLLSTERRDLMGDPKDWFHTEDNGFAPRAETITVWPAGTARSKFLARFFELGGA